MAGKIELPVFLVKVSIVHDREKFGRIYRGSDLGRVRDSRRKVKFDGQTEEITIRVFGILRKILEHGLESGLSRFLSQRYFAYK